MMCDQAWFSSEAFNGKVRIAAFNDGCGWGTASRGAAHKANETVLVAMEDGMRALNTDDQVDPPTSRDIIRVHDGAMMEAHAAVTNEEPLGSTCSSDYDRSWGHPQSYTGWR